MPTIQYNGFSFSCPLLFFRFFLDGICDASVGGGDGFEKTRPI
jgi:hypothetical protein